MGRSSLKNVMRLIDTANNQLSVEHEFLNDLEASIEKQAMLDSKKPSQTFKPSGMNCERSMVYQVLGIEPDISNASYQSIGIAESGTDRHVRIQKAIESMKDILNTDCEFVDVAQYVEQHDIKDLEIKGQSGMECKLYHKKLNMSFMCDGIIRYKSKYYIFEFKTETADKFYNRKDVDESHHNQATAYSMAFGIDDVLFLYENRNTLDKKAFLHHISFEDRENLLNKLSYCQEFVDKNKIPPKPENVLKKACTYCAYKSKCQEDNF